jgi:hypothetical protein
MHRIYSNGICNLASCNTVGPQRSIIIHRDPTVGAPFRVDCTWQDCFIGFSVLFDWFDVTSRHAPLYSRGWVLQEQQLSPRTLHLSTFPIWECREAVLTEVFPCQAFHKEYSWLPTPNKLNISTLGLESSILFWKNSVESYSARDLTKNTDRLVAIAGIAKTLSRELGQEYFAGIWGKDIYSGLLWQVAKNIEGHTKFTTRRELGETYLGMIPNFPP